MRLALALARRAEGRTAPNPMVGAVVVTGGRIVGRGYHRRAGQPHAEVEALREAGARARGSTLYVTLEPCNHEGRTPPCARAIAASGVRRVVFAVRDPNPITDGRGAAALRRARIQVTEGVLREDARRLNEPFFTAMTAKRPLVIAKVAQSLDGKIATVTGESRWISSPASRRMSHAWRGRVDAILVGINTVLADDPRLTARGVAHRKGCPVKVIVDSRLRLPPTAACLRGPAPLLIATTTRDPAKAGRLARRGAELMVFRPRQGRVPLRALFQQLARRGIQSVLIEGGGEVLAGALAERLVDRVAWCVAPLLIGGRTAPGAVGGTGVSRLARAVRFAELKIQQVGPDLWVEGRAVYPR